MTTYLYTVIPAADVYPYDGQINNGGYVFSFYSTVYDTSDGSTQTIDYPNSTSTTVADVSDSGEVIGVYEDNSNPVAFADNAGTYTVLNLVADPQTAPIGLKGYECFVGVSDINSSGEIVGNFSDDAGTFGFTYSNGVTTLLPASIGYYPVYDQYGNLDVTYYPVASALNDAGDIIGSYYTKLNDGTYQQQGFLLTAGVNPTFTPIADPSGVAGSTELLYINNSDQIVGEYTTPGQDKQVFFLYSGGTYTDIVGPASAANVSVSGINDHGDLVGSYTDPSGNYHGFIYDSATATYTTFNYNGASTGNTLLTGINDSGALLGYYISPTNAFTEFVATPAVAPTVTGISATTHNNITTLGVGGVVTITVDMSETVTVTGKPTLQLSDQETASYQSGSGTNVLTFSYTVLKGDTSSDLQVTGLNLPSGAAIRDQVGDALSGPVTKALGLVVDTNTPAIIDVKPQVTSGPTPNTGYAVGGDTVEIDVTFSDGPLVVTGTPELKLGSLVATYNAAASNLAGGVLAFDYTVAGGQKLTALKIASLTLPKGDAITDAAGNAANLKLSSADKALGLSADGVAPTVKSVKAKSSTKTLADGSVVTITLTMSEAVTVTGSPSLTLNDNGTATYAGGSGGKTLTFTYDVGSETSTDLQITGITQSAGNAITDLAGNALSSAYGHDLKLKVNQVNVANAAHVADSISDLQNVTIALFGNYLASFAPAADHHSGSGITAPEEAASHHAMSAPAHG